MERNQECDKRTIVHVVDIFMCIMLGIVFRYHGIWRLFKYLFLIISASTSLT